VKSRSEIAIKKFSEGYNCSQSVLYAFCDYLSLDRDLALRMSCGFGAGMGRKQEVCGAITGGILVISTKFGRGDLDVRKSTELTYKKTRKLLDRFAEKHDTYLCRKLINGCELQTDDGQKQFKDKNLLNKVCKPCVESVIEILENLMSKAV